MINSNITKQLKNISQKLNRKDCPSKGEIFSFSSDLLECLYEIPEELRNKYINGTAKELRKIWNNYDKFHTEYNSKRTIINQIRGRISELIHEISNK